MNKDFHYYATYSAAFLAGYEHEEALAIARSAVFVDLCTVPVLSFAGAPISAATTMLAMEMADAGTDPVSQQNITRIWASFHFLPYDLYAKKKGCGKRYMDKYRMICRPNGELLKDTVMQVKDKTLEAAGIAMHVMADTWAHQNFAGTPSLVINDTNRYFFEIMPDGSERKVKFVHGLGIPDDLEAGVFVNSIAQGSETSVMNLGHGRAGHIPDYSFMKYKYMPAWDDYDLIIKDNPSDYMKAYTQMVYTLRFLRGDIEEFELDKYDTETIAPYKEEIDGIIRKRQTDCAADWKAFGEKLSGKELPEFVPAVYLDEYKAAGAGKNDTPMGRFVIAALAQKSMVTNRVYRSGSRLAGVSVEYKGWGLSLKGIKDYHLLADVFFKGGRKK